MGQLIASTVLILSFLGAISIGCLIVGVAAIFDGGPMWFALFGLLLGVMGLFCTYYHLSLAISAYRHWKRTEKEAVNDRL